MVFRGLLVYNDWFNFQAGFSELPLKSGKVQLPSDLFFIQASKSDWLFELHVILVVSTVGVV